MLQELLADRFAFICSLDSWIPGASPASAVQNYLYDRPRLSMMHLWSLFDFFLEDALMNSWSCTQVSRCLFRVSRRKGKVKAKDPMDSKAIFLSKPFLKVYSVHSTTTTWQRPSLKMYLTKAPSLWVWLVYKHWQHSRQNLQSLDLGRWILKVLSSLFPVSGGGKFSKFPRMDARATRLLELQEAAFFFQN